jgi:hypothetical protein
MKKLLAALGIALGACVAALPASAAVITFSPSAAHVNVGDTINVDVNISGLGPEILSAFDVDLLFNDAVLSNFAVTHAAIPHMGGIGSSYFDTNFGAGRTEVMDGSLLLDADLLGQADAFTILTFSFQALADGESLLAFGPDLDFERNFVGLNALSLTMDIGSACISVGTGTCEVAPLPEPASLALVGMALAGMLVPLALRRRREEHRA